MAEEIEVKLSDEEAQARIAAAFLALNDIYELHAPNQTEAAWTCDECNGAEWPCKTEQVILTALGL